MGTVFLAVAAFYGASLANRYTFDDVYIVERDRLIRTLAGIPALFRQDWWAPFGRMGLYRPLTKVTFALGWAAAPGSPGWYHLVNVLLHALAAVLVLRLAQRWMAEGFALIAGLWFALIPTQVEVVAGLVGRADLLAVIFALAALLAFVRVEEGAARARRVRQIGTYASPRVGRSSGRWSGLGDDMLKHIPRQRRAALAAYRQAWQLKPSLDHFLQLADEELKLGDNAAVLQASRGLHSPLGSLDPMAGLAVGLAQLRLGQLAAAAATLAAVVARMPENARAHLYYGQAWHALGREPEASQQLQWLARHVPGGGPAPARAAFGPSR